MNPGNPFSSGPAKEAPKEVAPVVLPEETAPAAEELKAEKPVPAKVPAKVPVRAATMTQAGELPPLGMEETSCRTCQFCHFEVESRSDVSQGECRYNAPSPGIDERASWPVVDWSSWCGQWQSGISDDDMVKMARIVADEMVDGGSLVK